MTSPRKIGLGKCWVFVFFLSTLEMHRLMEVRPQADSQNQLGYDQEKATLDQWLPSTALHNRRHRFESTFSPEIEC